MRKFLFLGFVGVFLGVFSAGCGTTRPTVTSTCPWPAFKDVEIQDKQDACWLASRVVERFETCSRDRSLDARLMPNVVFPCLKDNRVEAIEIAPVVPGFFFVSFRLDDTRIYVVDFIRKDGLWMAKTVELSLAEEVLD